MTLKLNIFGAAGTGKTTYIINSMFKLLDGGQTLDSIAYVTYTRASRKDFQERLRARGIPEEEIRHAWVGTQHALCFRLLGLSPNAMIREQDRVAFCKSMNPPLEYSSCQTRVAMDDELPIEEISPDALFGNNFFTLIEKCALLSREPNRDDLENFSGNISTREILFYKAEWDKWKQANGKVTFTDMLSTVLSRKLCFPPTVRYLFFDEFQDYGHLQNTISELWEDAPTVELRIIAGDDDQAIYSFNGADPKYMLEKKGEVIILPINYRNAPKIYQFATRLIRRNTVRKDKDVRCVRPEEGCIEIEQFSHKPQERIIDLLNGKKTFFLARANWQVREIQKVLDRMFIPYSLLRGQTPWTPAFLNLLNAIYKITTTPNEKLTNFELHEFINYLPAKQYLVRGKKKELMKISNEFSFSELRRGYLKPIEKTLVDYARGVRTEQGDYIDAVIAKLQEKSKRQHNIASLFMESGGGMFDIQTPINLFVGTMHSAKGLDTEDCFIFDGMSYKTEKAIRSSDAALEEERRVNYVALTRPKFRLVIVLDFFSSASMSFLRDYERMV